ncbi:putative NBD/HSP70 family sugar kinase [Motilibacter rhizosphaerae]|uniref:Putative NBD/HSP70 family sugar kinase n=1 Tax=Motilibacter rhizosphaerae TaxID=598652 RepID=A0A4V2F2F0_9ACTN|nr:ROK family transcriptional regulator [Motilibacter rhizosphaerae]RZS77918.1 putative NBD/HSP70 family sugar kinase [Motilibacter rhizosphaerae]
MSPAPGAHGSTSLLRDANEVLVAGILREDGPASRADLGRATGLSRSTIAAIVASLLRAGVLVEDGAVDAAARPQGGRPGSLLRFRPEVASVAVCALYQGEVAVTLCDASGAVRERSLIHVDLSSERCLEEVADEVERLAGVPGTPPLGAVTVLSPGLIDRRTGVCLSFPPYGWTDVPLKEPLARRLDVPVTVLSPPSAAVLGELADGAAVGHDEVLMVFLHIGLAAGAVTRGRVVHGAAGAVGELGHCRTTSSTDPCICGRAGCLETVAAGWAIDRKVRQVLRRKEIPHTLAGLAAVGNARVDGLLHEAAVEVGRATAWMVNMLNPSIVLLGGTAYAQGATAYFELFRETVRAEAISTGHAEPEFALVGPDSDIRGAIRAALEQLPEPVRPRRSFHV